MSGGPTETVIDAIQARRDQAFTSRSLAFAEAANYCPVLVGAIGGARWGESSIPHASLDHADVLPRVRAAAEALAAKWDRGGS